MSVLKTQGKLPLGLRVKLLVFKLNFKRDSVSFIFLKKKFREARELAQQETCLLHYGQSLRIYTDASYSSSSL